MQAVVIKKFKDKYTGEVYPVGAEIEVTEERATEIMEAGKYIVIPSEQAEEADPPEALGQPEEADPPETPEQAEEADPPEASGQPEEANPPEVSKEPDEKPQKPEVAPV